MGYHIPARIFVPSMAVGAGLSITINAAYYAYCKPDVALLNALARR
jgi:hypothetical protein